MIRDFVQSVKSGETSAEEHTFSIIKEAKKANKTLHHFNAIDELGAIEQARKIDKRVKLGKADGKLLGVPISVKDAICVKGIESTAGSAILKGYKPVFDATVVRKAKEAGAIIIGKTAQDAFGFGTFSVNVGNGFSIPRNPLDLDRSCGGSSGGSGGFTAFTEHEHLSIGESTGGSIAAPASFCGVVGLCPTYGRVSRYGLMDYASSLDKIGPMGKTVDDAVFFLEVLAGMDERDSTSLDSTVPDYSSSKKKKMKIGVVKEFFGKGIDKEVSDAVWKKIKALESEGFSYEEISLPLNAKYGMACYYLMAVAEASTNLAKYCGMRCGAEEKLEDGFDKYFTKVRSSYLGEEAKRRIILGTFARMSGFRDAYYLRAVKVRTVLINEFKKAFKKVDVLVNPTMPVVAPKFSEIEKLTPLQNYAMDLCTCPANLAGMPHLSVKAGEHKKMPIGIMFTANHLEEEKLASIGKAVEEVSP